MRSKGSSGQQEPQCAAKAQQCVAGSAMQAVHGGQYVSGSTWQAVHGGQYVAGSTWRAVREGQYMAGSTWRAVRDGQHVTGSTRRAVVRRPTPAPLQAQLFQMTLVLACSLEKLMCQLLRPPSPSAWLWMSLPTNASWPLPCVMAAHVGSMID